MEASVLCNGLCGNHGADHAVFRNLARDKAIDKTIEHAHRMGMFRNVAMCQACLCKYIFNICNFNESSYDVTVLNILFE